MSPSLTNILQVSSVYTCGKRIYKIVAKLWNNVTQFPWFGKIAKHLKVPFICICVVYMPMYVLCEFAPYGWIWLVSNCPLGFFNRSQFTPITFLNLMPEIKKGFSLFWKKSHDHDLLWAAAKDAVDLHMLAIQEIRYNLPFHHAW